MTFIYCFCNVSLTQRILTYLSKKLQHINHCVTVIFFNEYWIVQVKIESDIGSDINSDAGTANLKKINVENINFENIRSFLSENGLPYSPCIHIQQILDDISSGNDIIDIMRRHHIVIVSHGKPHFENIQRFREVFVKALGYCPPSLV